MENNLVEEFDHDEEVRIDWQDDQKDEEEDEDAKIQN